MNRKIVPWIITAVGLAGAAALAPSIAANYSDMSGRRQLVSGNEVDIQQALVEHDQIVARQKLAEERYKLGCLFIMETRNKTFVSLHQDMVIVDRITGDPIPDNSLVCDVYGSVALTFDGGKIRSIVSTTNSVVVHEALARAQETSSFHGVKMPDDIDTNANLPEAQ